MTIQEWSDEITVVELGDDPQFTDELGALADRLEDKHASVVLNLAAVSYLNSSNIARLLRLRKRMMLADRQLILCAVNSQVKGVFQVTGLDKILRFADDVSTALATMQLSQGPASDE